MFGDQFWFHSRSTFTFNQTTVSHAAILSLLKHHDTTPALLLELQQIISNFSLQTVCVCDGGFGSAAALLLQTL